MLCSVYIFISIQILSLETTRRPLGPQRVTICLLHTRSQAPQRSSESHVNTPFQCIYEYLESEITHLQSTDKTFFGEKQLPRQNALWSKVASWPCEWEGDGRPWVPFSSDPVGQLWPFDIQCIQRKSLNILPIENRKILYPLFIHFFPHDMGKSEESPAVLEVPVFPLLYMW